MSIGYFLLFAECCYYALLGIAVALAVTLPVGLGYLCFRRPLRRRRAPARTFPERNLHELDPDRERARRTAAAFRRIVEGTSATSPNLRDVGRRGLAIAAKHSSSRQRLRSIRKRTLRRSLLRTHKERQSQ